MRCPFCHSGRTKVVEKRASSEGINRRRRECLDCKKRFTTYEKVEVNLVVVKKNGRREAYDRTKLLESFLKACKKRPIPIEKIESAVYKIEQQLLHEGKSEIDSTRIGMLVLEHLKKIDLVAYVRFASVFKSFDGLTAFEKELKKLKVVKESSVQKDSTDIHLQVATTTQGTVSEWDKEKIVRALVTEAGLRASEAKKIADAVEQKVFASGIKILSVSLIRELVDNELFVRGYGKKLQKQSVLGMPTYNLRQFIMSSSKENSNILTNNPEAVNLAIAETILKQYALKEIFSSDVAKAHFSGAIHIHDLGYPIRVYCSSHSVEYLKRFGLRLNNLSTASSPAKHAMTLTGHLNTFLASIQAYYAGALGLSYLNIFYAPFLVGLSKRELKQQAQYLIFSCSQNAFSRGGQSLFIDFNVHLGVPKELEDVPAIGPGGKYMIKRGSKIEYVDDIKRDKNGKPIKPKKGRFLTYKDFEREAQAFAKALLEVWHKGDCDGKVFPFPKCDLHINQHCFDDPKQRKLLFYACEVAADNGSPYFVFDRDSVNLSMCCRLRTSITDKMMLTRPESLRFCGFQNVSINLPQAAYRAGKGNVEGAIKEIQKAMELAMKAHLQKKRFIARLMSKPGLPLWQVGAPAADGRPYIDLEKSTYIFGIVGLNECVQYLCGKQLHESDSAYKLGLRIIASMAIKLRKLEKKYGLKLALEETPGESAVLRFARIDLKNFPQSKECIKGDIEKGEIYYTNSVHLAPDADCDIIERIIKQSRFSPLIEAGSITHVFLGEQRPDPTAIFRLIKKVWENTECAQLTISPEFTICNRCRFVSRGYGRNGKPKCERCGSDDVYGISRVVGYFSRIDRWNASKRAEFRDRQKGNYKIK